MSLVFSRISKSYFRKSVRILCFRQDSSVQKNIRSFSSSPSPSPSPYLLLPSDVVEESPAGGSIVNFNLYDPRKEEIVKFSNQKLPRGLYPAERVGSSHGWLALLNKRDLTLHLTNMFNPSASPSSHRVISLPPLDSLPCFLSFNRNQDGSVRNIIPRKCLNFDLPDIAAGYMVDHVSLSSSPDQDDCVVAVWLYGDYLSFCRPGDSRWICNKDSLDTAASNLMYSKRDRVFYRISETTDCVHVHDLNNPRFRPRSHEYECARFQNIPEITDPEVEMLRKCSEKEYIVETPTGELLVATRYVQSFHEGKEVQRAKFEGHDLFYKTARFIVYRLDIKLGTRTYTEDIGDLSLFLGKNESFCLPASQYPGLKSNSIYFTDDNDFVDPPSERYAGQDMGLYNLSEKTVTEIYSSGQDNIVPAPIWLAPPALSA